MPEKKRPNFLFILSDDQGYWSLGAYGNSEVHSPVLDRLAAEGARFDSFYCCSPVCSPARASILTGQMPSHHGVLDWLGGGAVRKEDYADLQLPRELVLQNLSEDVSAEEIDPAAKQLPFSLTRNFRRYMANETTPRRYLTDITYTEQLAQAGYRCGISGKWHLGAGAEKQAGFNFWSVVPRGGTPYRMPDWISDGQIHIGTQYVTDLITDEALRFLADQDANTPFYLSVHYTAPHDPWRKEDQPEDIWAEYDGCPFRSLPRNTLHPDQVMKRPHPEDEAQLREMAQAYYSCITAMDRNIGRLLADLEERKLLENTIVIFTSDNGLNFGHHGIWGKGNGTYPMNLYETSVRVPFIMWNPYYIRGGQCIHTPLSHYDLFPTFLELAGVQQEDTLRPGRSFATLLSQAEKAPPREVIVCDEYGPVRMIRWGDWKLIRNVADDNCELYYLPEDPDETNNRIHDPSCHSLADALKNSLSRWFARYSVAAYDGSQYPVNGEGQMAPALLWYRGEKVFVSQNGQMIPCPKQGENK